MVQVNVGTGQYTGITWQSRTEQTTVVGAEATPLTVTSNTGVPVVSPLSMYSMVLPSGAGEVKVGAAKQTKKMHGRADQNRL